MSLSNVCSVSSENKLKSISYFFINFDNAFRPWKFSGYIVVLILWMEISLGHEEKSVKNTNTIILIFKTGGNDNIYYYTILPEAPPLFRHMIKE